jgi:hypothetical protein
MSFSHRIRTRLIRRVALGLAVAAVVAPSAGAYSFYSSQLQHTWTGPSEAYPPGAVIEAPMSFAYPPGAVKEGPGAIDWPAIAVGPEGFLTSTKAPPAIDWRAIEVGPGGQLTATPAPEADAPVSYPIGAPRPIPQTTPIVVPVSDTGFDWRIGATAGLGVLAAIVLGAAMLFSRRRGTLQGV